MKCPFCGSEEIDFIAERNITIRAKVLETNDVEDKTHVKVGEYSTENDNKSYFKCTECGKKIVVLDAVLDSNKTDETGQEEKGENT